MLILYLRDAYMPEDYFITDQLMSLNSEYIKFKMILCLNNILRPEE